MKSVNKENHSSSESLLTASPPPIPPRPVNSKCINRHFDDILPPPLHNNSALFIPPLPALPQSNESLSDLYSISNETLEDIRKRLREEFPFEIHRIDAALILTEGLTFSKQYTMAKLFLNQVKYEQEQSFPDSFQLEF